MKSPFDRPITRKFLKAVRAFKSDKEVIQALAQENKDEEPHPNPHLHPIHTYWSYGQHKLSALIEALLQLEEGKRSIEFF